MKQKAARKLRLRRKSRQKRMRQFWAEIYGHRSADPLEEWEDRVLIEWASCNPTTRPFGRKAHPMTPRAKYNSKGWQRFRRIVPWRVRFAFGFCLWIIMLMPLYVAYAAIRGGVEGFGDAIDLLKLAAKGGGE